MELPQIHPKFNAAYNYTDKFSCDQSSNNRCKTSKIKQAIIFLIENDQKKREKEQNWEKKREEKGEVLRKQSLCSKWDQLLLETDPIIAIRH